MNEHIQKGNEALAREDLQTAKAEFTLAKCDSDQTIQRIAENRLRDIEKKDRELSESKTRKSPKIQTERDRPEIGWLSYLGYHVGDKGIPKKKRRDILKEAFYLTIPREARFSEEQVEWWGKAGSQKRLEQLCYRLSTLGGKEEEAVNDRKDDLLWLVSEFRKEVFPGFRGT